MSQLIRSDVHIKIIKRLISTENRAPRNHIFRGTFFFLLSFGPITELPAFQDYGLPCLQPWAPAYVSKHTSHILQSHLSPVSQKYFIADDHFNSSQDNVSDVKRWQITGIIPWEFSLREIPWCRTKEQICFVQRDTDCCKVQTVLWSRQPPVKAYHVICNTLAKKFSPGLFKIGIKKIGAINIFIILPLPNMPPWTACTLGIISEGSGNLFPSGRKVSIYLLLWVSLLPRLRHWASSNGPTALMSYGGDCTQTTTILQHWTHAHIQTHGLDTHTRCLYMCEHAHSQQWGLRQRAGSSTLHVWESVKAELRICFHFLDKQRKTTKQLV